MRKLLFALLGLALLSPMKMDAAQAAEPVDTLPTLYAYQIAKYSRTVNEACPKDTDTIFKLKVRVAPGYDGQFVDGDYGKGTLILANGRQLTEPDYPVPPDYYVNEYYWFAGRGAKLNLTTKADYVQFEAPGPNMDFRVGRVKRDCVERFGGDE